MKFKYGILAILTVAFAAFLSFRSNSGNSIAIETPDGLEVVNVPTGAAVVMDENDNISFLNYGVSGSDPLLKTWSQDTITNAENDTLTYSAVFGSQRQYSYQVNLSNLSGTRNIKVYLQQLNVNGSSDWMSVDSAITSGSAITSYHMKGQNVWGVRHRVVLDGTGTQSVAYRVTANYKRF